MPRRWNAYEQFKHSLTQRNVGLAHPCALEARDQLTLDDALDLVELYAATGHRVFERAAARWIVRAVLEHGDITLAEVGAIVEAMTGPPDGLAARVRAVLHSPEEW